LPPLNETHIDLDQAARAGGVVPGDDLHARLLSPDPHPGNFLLLDGNVIGLLDYGMVGEI